MPAGANNPRAHEVVEGLSRDALGEQSEQHESGVVVGEPLARRALLGVAREDGQEVLGVLEGVDGHLQDVVGDLALVLIQVVADPGGVGEQVADRHGVIDQRQIDSQHRAHGAVEGQRPLVDQRADDQGGEALGDAGDTQAVPARHRDLLRTIGQAEALLEHGGATVVHSDHAAEGAVRGGDVESLGEVVGDAGGRVVGGIVREAGGHGSTVAGTPHWS